MRSFEAEDWQKVSPLIYTYLSSVATPEYSSLSRTSFSKQDKSYFKYEEYRTIVAGHTGSHTGMLTIHNLLVPLARELDDDRIRASLAKVCQLSFESEVTHFDECTKAGQTTLAVVQSKNPLIYIYDSNALEKFKEKMNINPRKILRGHQSEVTAMRCNRGEVLSGARNGDVRLHPHGCQEDASVIYKYHRDQVNDFCWLTQQEDSHFITASADGFIYLWDRRSSLPATKIEPRQGELNCLEYLRDNCFLSGGGDGTVKLYDIRSGVNKFYIFKEHTAAITCLRRLQGKEGEVAHQVLFASGSLNGQVMVWGQQLQFVHLAHSSKIQSIVYDGSSDLFATVERSNPAICLWKPTIFNYQ